MAMDMTFSATSFPAAFDVNPAEEPLLGGFTTNLLSGDSVITGQYYISPSFLCIYTHANKKVVKIKIRLADIDRYEPVVCVNVGEILKPGISPVLVPEGSIEPVDVSAMRPNAVNLYTAGAVHTFIAGKGPYLIGLSLLYVAWSRAAAAAAAALPWAPRVQLRLATEYSLPASEFILRSLKGAVVSGEHTFPVLIQVWTSYITFTVHDAKVVVPLRDITRVAPSRSLKNPNPEAKGLVLLEVPLASPPPQAAAAPPPRAAAAAPPPVAKKKSRFGGFAKSLKTKAAAVAAMAPLPSSGPADPEAATAAAAAKPPNALQLFMRSNVKHQLVKIDFTPVYNVIMFAWHAANRIPGAVEYAQP